MNNCLICGKITHNKPNNFGDTLCSQQCAFIFDNRETLKANYQTLTTEIERLHDDIQYILKQLPPKCGPKHIFKTKEVSNV